MSVRGSRREVRYPDQVKPARRYRDPLPSGAEEMFVEDSIREQLVVHARRIAAEQTRQRRIYKFRGRSLDYVMMRTVELPAHDWSLFEEN